MNNFTVDDVLILLELILQKFSKLPFKVRDTLITILTEAEADSIEAMTRAELIDAIRCWGLLTKIQSLSDLELIEEYRESDLDYDPKLLTSISQSFTSVEYINLLDELQ